MGPFYSSHYDLSWQEKNHVFLITLTMMQLHSGVLESHNSVTRSLHNTCTASETEAAKWNSALVNFITVLFLTYCDVSTCQILHFL